MYIDETGEQSREVTNVEDDATDTDLDLEGDMISLVGEKGCLEGDILVGENMSLEALYPCRVGDMTSLSRS